MADLAGARLGPDGLPIAEGGDEDELHENGNENENGNNGAANGGNQAALLNPQGRVPRGDDVVVPKGMPILFSRDKIKVMHSEAPTAKPKPDFPSVWFAEKKTKPQLIVYKFTFSPAVLRKIVHKHLLAGQLHPDIAVAFLKDAASTFEHVLRQRIASFGQVIGEDGDKITPLSIVEVTEKDWGGAVPESTIATEPPSDAVLVASIAMAYRLAVAKSRGGTDAYLVTLRDRCKTMLSSPPYSDQGLHVDNWHTNKNWANHRDLRAMMAAYDMFFYIASDHEFSGIRAGTLVCRGRDCAVLGDLQRAARAMGQAPCDIFYWCFALILYAELDIVGTEGQELGEEFSYYHYASDLGVSKRSPFSASMCPGLHLLCNSVAALLGMEDAQNTRFVNCEGPNSVLSNAAFVAYAFREGTGFGPMVARTVDEARQTRADMDEEARKEQDNQAIDGEVPPLSQEPGVWHMYMRTRDWRLPHQITNWCRQRVALFKAVRAGSIAEFLRNRFSVVE